MYLYFNLLDYEFIPVEIALDYLVSSLEDYTRKNEKVRKITRRKSVIFILFLYLLKQKTSVSSPYLNTPKR